MGAATSVLECSNRYPWLGEVNCTVGSVAYGEFGSNPSITGIGVCILAWCCLLNVLANWEISGADSIIQTDISFVLTAGLSLLTCGVVQFFCDRLGKRHWRKLLEPLVVSFGDQQILRGLSLSIATIYTSSTCTVDAYRYNVLCYLLMMTVVSHLSSVLVLRSYVNGQIVLSCVRFCLVFTQIFFIGIIFSSRITDLFLTSIPSASEQEARNTTLVLPAVCFEHGASKPYTGLQDIPHPHNKDSAALVMYIMLFIFYGINIIITIAHVVTFFFYKKGTWERRSEDRAKRWSWFWWLGVMRGLILLSAWVIWIWAVVRMYKLRGWMDGSGWMSAADLMNDNQWTFGQLLSVLLLAAAPMSFANAWSGMIFSLLLSQSLCLFKT